MCVLREIERVNLDFTLLHCSYLHANPKSVLNIWMFLKTEEVSIYGHVHQKTCTFSKGLKFFKTRLRRGSYSQI